MINKTAILRSDAIDTKIKSSRLKTVLNRFNNGFVDVVLKENPTVDLVDPTTPWYVTVAANFSARVSSDFGIFESITCLENRLQALTETFYNSFSLLMFPHAYKQAKLYCQLPTDGTADLVFARVSTFVSLVNSANLVDDSPNNQINNTEQFQNWTAHGAGGTITQNDTTSPVGSLTADLYTETNNVLQGRYVDMNTERDLWLNNSPIFILYVKMNTRKNITLSFSNLGTHAAKFNIETGQVLATNNGVQASITSAGNGWWKCSITSAPYTSTVFYPEFWTNTDETAAISRTAFAGSSSLWVWGAALYKLSEKSYVEVGTNKQNFPRLDYTGVTCPVFLMEPASANAYSFSEKFDDASWSKARLTVSANAIVGPSGRTDADKIIDDTHNNNHSIFKAANVSNSSKYVWSIYAKAGELTWGYLSTDNAQFTAYLNLSNGTLGTNTRVTLFKSIPMGNGWYRYCIMFTATVTASINIYLSTSPDGTTFNYAGTGTQGFYIWGACFEQGVNLVGSYIPSAGGAVTRAVEACSKSAITSLIGQTEGTLFLDIITTADGTTKAFSITDGTTNNRVSILINSLNEIRPTITNGGSVQMDVSVTTLVTGTRYKMALTYKSNYAAFFLNGVKMTEDLSINVPGCSVLAFDDGATNRMNGQIFGAGIMKTALSDVDAQTLTSI